MSVGLVGAGDTVDVPAGDTVDVLLVQLGSTEGLRVADEELVGSLRRAGAHVVVASAAHPDEIRTLMLTDLRWARAARRAAVEALAQLRGNPPRSVIYSTTTASLLWPLPGAIRFDCLRRGQSPRPPRAVAAPAGAPPAAPGAAAAALQRGRARGGRRRGGWGP